LAEAAEKRINMYDFDVMCFAFGGIDFTNNLKTETRKPDLEFDDFKPSLESSIFKCISWLNGLFV
jgi:hypothetical protein